MTEKAAISLPLGACDCHTHIFDPEAVTADPPAYPLPVAPYDDHRRMLDSIGAERGILVQPSAYGSDHSVAAAAIGQSSGRLRGVGLLDRAASEDDFDRLHKMGFRALRFVEARVPGSGERFPGNVAIDDLAHLAEPMARRGWHAEIWAPLDEAADICDVYATQGVPLVFDHLCGATASTMPGDENVIRIARHVASGNVWVKFVLCRVAARLPDAMAVRPVFDVLLTAHPGRMVWGTDFPFVRKGADAPDPHRLVEIGLEWAGQHRVAIFTDNPSALYGFEK